MKFRQFELSNLKIACFESDGEEMPVFLVHSNSIGAASFYWQMESELGQKHKFISIDLPGHGASDFSFQPETYYNVDKLADIVASVIDFYGYEKYVVCAHGSGFHIAVRAIRKLPKLSGFIISGALPLKEAVDYEKVYNIDEVFKLFHKGRLSEAEVSVVAQKYISEEDVAEIMFVDNIKNTDPNFRKYYPDSIINNHQNELEILKNIDVPIAVLMGDKERIVNLNVAEKTTEGLSLWRDKLHVISDAGNTPMWEKYKLFNYFIESFLADLE